MEDNRKETQQVMLEGENQGEHSSISLAQLNAEFTTQQIEKKKATKKNKKGILIFILCTMVLMGIGLRVGIQVSDVLTTSEGTRLVDPEILAQGVLTKDEIQEWEETPVDKEEVFFKLNTTWSLSGEENKVFIRLLNPLYSYYPLRVEIYLKEKPEKIIYTSKILAPGSIVEYAKLNPKPEVGEHEAIVKYTFYKNNSEKEILGVHELTATLKVTDKGRKEKNE